MPRGITSDVPSGGGKRSNFIRHVRLREDGEFSRLWFLTEGDQIFWAEFHNVKNSESVGPRWYTKICVRAAFGQACENCEAAEEDSRGPVSRARTEFLAWTFETLHFYPEKPAKVETKRATVGDMKMHVEEVNEPRLLRASIMHRGPIKARMERRGTLLDGPFDWIRAGEAGSKRPTYTLEALDKEKMPKELKELMAELPDLEDVALGKVERLDGKGGDDEDGGGGKKYATRTVSLEDGGDEDTNDFGRGGGDEDDEKPKARKASAKAAQKPAEDEPEGGDDDDDDPFA